MMSAFWSAVCTLMTTFMLQVNCDLLHPVHINGALELGAKRYQAASSSTRDRLLEIVSASRTLRNPASVLPVLRDVASEGDSASCIALVIRVCEDFLEKRTYALAMLDAFGKPQSGVLKGSFSWLGSYDECVTAAYVSQDTRIKGQYCLASIPFPVEGTQVSLPLLIGLCLPDVCGNTGAEHLMKTVELILPLNISNTDCQPLSKPVPDGPAIAVISLLSLIVVLIIIATAYDEYQHQSTAWNKPQLKLTVSAFRTDSDGINVSNSDLHESEGRSGTPASHTSTGSEIRTVLDVTDYTPLIQGAINTNEQNKPHSQRLAVQCLLAFSLRSNGAKLLKTNVSGCGQLPCLHGIRFFSMTWVILGNTYLLGMTYTANVVEVLDMAKNPAFAPIPAGSVSVDSFFVLSGTLVSFLLLKELDNKGGPSKFNWAKFYFHRFWRLSPPYFLLLGFYTAVFQYVGSGPIWPHSQISGFCNETWWGNVLYIQNIAMPANKQCFDWAWYLACDIQCYVLSPLFIIPLYRYKSKALPVIILAICGSCVTTGVLTYINNYPADFPVQLAKLQTMHTEDNDFLRYIYFAPWTHICTYLVGIFLGFLLFNHTKHPVHLRKVTVVLGWLSSAACCFTVVYMLTVAGVEKGHQLSRPLNALYASAFRTVWALAVSWVIFACVTGYGGFVNSFLSWSPLFVASRLTYMTYLLHPIIMYWFWLSSQSPFILTFFTLVWQFLAFLLASYLAAFGVSLALEAPMIALERILLRRS